MKKVHIITLLIGLVLIPLFQNCGMDASTAQRGGLLIGVKTPDCLSTVVDCGPKPEYLEITIDLSNPSVFAASNTSFVIYGRCNEGNYDTSMIRYKVYEATDLETPVDTIDKISNNSLGGDCRNGKYHQSINIAVSPSTGYIYTVNTAYVIKVEMIGYDPNTGTQIFNHQANGSATIDFTKQ